MDSSVSHSSSRRASGPRDRRWLSALACVAFLGIGIAIGSSVTREARTSHVVDLSLAPATDWIDDVCASFRVFGRKYQPMIDIGPGDDAAFRELSERTIGIAMNVPNFDNIASIFEGARVDCD